MTLWLYLHFPSLQLDSLYSSQQDAAIVIVEAKKNAIVQLNKVALAQGIKLGMGLGTASSLCADLHVHPYQENSEKEKLIEIAHWLYIVTADITFFQPNGLLLRVSNMLTLHQGLNNYWQILQQHLAQLNVHYCFASGYSPLAAQLLAQTAFNQVSDDKNYLHQAIKPIHLTQTTLAAKDVVKLQRIGVKNLQALIDIPLAELGKRFDIQLVNYIGRLTGQFKHLVEFYHPPQQFKRHLELLFDIENSQWLLKPLTLLLVKLEHFLLLRSQIVHEIVITLIQRDAADLNIKVSSAQGEYKAQKWLTLSQLSLENIKMSAPVYGITLIANRVAALSANENDLFSGNKGTRNPLELLAILQAKLGESAVKGLSLNDDVRPELSSQYCSPKVKSKTCQLSVKRNKLRPSLLLPKPQRLQDKVTVVQGPERIASGWWDGAPIVRDYFVARSEHGQWLWIFKNPKNEWFLHGAFS